MNAISLSAAQFRDLADGRLAHDDSGDGPLVVATPAMLDQPSRRLGPHLKRIADD
jgi:hypothetical protein